MKQNVPVAKQMHVDLNPDASMMALSFDTPGGVISVAITTADAARMVEFMIGQLQEAWTRRDVAGLTPFPLPTTLTARPIKARDFSERPGRSKSERLVSIELGVGTMTFSVPVTSAKPAGK